MYATVVAMAPPRATAKDDGPTTKRGWVVKAHRGQPFDRSCRERFMVSHGFHVTYYRDNAMKLRKGRFDLRNVIALLPSEDPACLHGVDVLLSEGRQIPPVITKTLRFSFGTAALFEQWMVLWTSAADVTRVADALLMHRSSHLANKINALHWQQLPCRSSVRVGTMPMLSPRSAADAHASVTSSRSSSGADVAPLADAEQPTSSSELLEVDSAWGEGVVPASQVMEVSVMWADAPAEVDGSTHSRTSLTVVPENALSELSLADGCLIAVSPMRGQMSEVSLGQDLGVPPPPATPPPQPPLASELSITSAVRGALQDSDPLALSDALSRTESDNLAEHPQMQQQVESEPSLPRSYSAATAPYRKGSVESRVYRLMASSRQDTGLGASDRQPSSLRPKARPNSSSSCREPIPYLPQGNSVLRTVVVRRT